MSEIGEVVPSAEMSFYFSFFTSLIISFPAVVCKKKSTKLTMTAISIRIIMTLMTSQKTILTRFSPSDSSIDSDSPFYLILFA